MNAPAPRPRRSLVVKLLDATLRLATAVQTAQFPAPRPASRVAAGRGGAGQQRAGLGEVGQGGAGLGRAGRGRAGLAWLAIGALAAAAGTAVLVIALVRAPDGLTELPPAVAGPPATSAAPSPGPVSTAAAAAVSSASVRPAPSSAPPVSPTPSRPTSAPAEPARLAAHYESDGAAGLLSYGATVTITNTGGRPGTDWRLTVTLPRPTLRIGAVTGATVEQDGSTWTFTPVAGTRQVAAGRPVQVSFQVRGATLVGAEPTACSLGAEPCTGLPAAS